MHQHEDESRPTVPVTRTDPAAGEPENRIRHFWGPHAPESTRPPDPPVDPAAALGRSPA